MSTFKALLSFHLEPGLGCWVLTHLGIFSEVGVFVKWRIELLGLGWLNFFRSIFFMCGEDKCKHYRVENEGGSPVTAYAKVTSCTDMGTCLRLAHPQWVRG